MLVRERERRLQEGDGTWSVERTGAMDIGLVDQRDGFLVNLTESRLIRRLVGGFFRYLQQEVRGASPRKTGGGERNALHRDALQFVVYQRGDFLHLLGGKVAASVVAGGTH